MTRSERENRGRPPRWFPAVFALLLAGVATPCLAQGADPRRAQAVALYDAGNFPEARSLLEQLDAAGLTGGADLYRLYYCQNTAGDPESRNTLSRALAALEAELPAADSLEVPSYLSNAYRNVARLSDMRRVASETVAKVENGDWPAPATGVEMFRLGRLYSDAEQDDKAVEWLASAIDALSHDSTPLSPYAKWASRYLAERAMRQGDSQAAGRYLELMLADGDGTPEDFQRLAVIHAERGDYVAAARAWGKAVMLDPARGDHARYCSRLALMASELEEVPTVGPDGRALDGLAATELVALMIEQVQAARALIAETAQKPELTLEDGQAVTRQLERHKGWFVAAGLKYALDGHPIRETAFQNGFAPMVFRSREWELPPRRRGRRRLQPVSELPE